MGEISGFTTMSPRLLTVFQSSSFNSVRMEALKLLSRYANEDFVEAIRLGLYDAYELIRRNAAIYAGKCGDPRLAEAVVDVLLNQPESQRVNYILQGALMLLPEKQGAGVYFAKEENTSQLMQQLNKDVADNVQTLAMLQDARSPQKKQISVIRYVRNYPRHANIDAYLSIIENASQAEEVRVNMAEALGWFNYSYRKNEIRQALENMLKRDQMPGKVKLEVEQTINRLK